MALASAPAVAKQVHVFNSSFGTEGSGPGQFKEPSAVAVNNATGNVYVVDKGNNRVQEFDSTGTAVLAEFDGAAAPTGALAQPEAIAVDNSGSPLDPSKEDVYVTDTGHNAIDKFTASGTYLGQITQGDGGAALEELVGVAVDANGVVWATKHFFQIFAFSD
jgi:DNA-binding beta-propeller fold protein YncE